MPATRRPGFPVRTRSVEPRSHKWASESQGHAFWLANAAFRDQPTGMRTWSSWRRTLALLFAVFVTAGLSLPAVQATEMSVKMTMTSDMGTGDRDCATCPRGADDSGNPKACSPVCVAPAFALLPQDPAVVTAIQASMLPSLPSPFLHGRGSLPDPSPPKPSGLG